MIECANKENLVECGGCGAVYDKTLRWFRGFHSSGTADDFTPYALVKEHRCPVCNKENK